MLKVNDWGGDEFEPVLVLCTRPETAVCMYIFEQRHYPPQTTLFATPAYNSQPFKAQQPESQPQPQSNDSGGRKSNRIQKKWFMPRTKLGHLTDCADCRSAQQKQQ